MTVRLDAGDAGSGLPAAQRRAPVRLPQLVRAVNGVMRRRSTADAEPLLERARRFFSEHDRSFVAYAWPGDPEVERAASRTGMRRVVQRYPEMICRSRCRRCPVICARSRRRLTRQAYWAICDAAYPSVGSPRGMFGEAFEASELLDARRVRLCIAYDDDQPVACASAWMAAT